MALLIASKTRIVRATSDISTRKSTKMVSINWPSGSYEVLFFMTALKRVLKLRYNGIVHLSSLPSFTLFFVNFRITWANNWLSGSGIWLVSHPQFCTAPHLLQTDNWACPCSTPSCWTFRWLLRLFLYIKHLKDSLNQNNMFGIYEALTCASDLLYTLGIEVSPQPTDGF